MEMIFNTNADEEILICLYKNRNDIIWKEKIKRRYVKRSSSSVDNSCKKMNKEGLIELKWKKNRREKIISLTEKGQQIAKKLVDIERMMR